MAVVVDASVAMGWLLRSQSGRLSDAVEKLIISDGGWVPAHFGLEIARTLRRFERHGELTSDAVDQAFAELSKLHLTQDSPGSFGNIHTAVLLARKHALRVADAAYLELAIRLDLPLATRDRKLATAAADAGANVLRG